MKIETINLNDYATEVSRKLTVKAIQDIEEAVKGVGPELVHDLTLHFIAHFVGAAVYRVLTEKRTGTKKEITLQVQDEFAAFKFGVQDSIALAFQGAMSSYSRINIDYYCKILPVPPMTSKHHC